MKLPIIRLSALLTVIIFLVFVLLFIPSLYKEEGGSTQTKDKISSSLFVLGSNDKKPVYQSVDFSSTDTDVTPIEKISLEEFLRKDTQSTEEDLVPTSNLERSELKKYGNKVGDIDNTYLPETLDEVAILSAFVTEPKNQDARSELLSLSERYKNISNELSSVKAPDSMLSFHNDFKIVHESIADALTVLLKDGITEETLENYNKTPSQYINTYLNIAQYLRVRGVHFEESEPGSLFTLPF